MITHRRVCPRIVRNSFNIRPSIFSTCIGLFLFACTVPAAKAQFFANYEFVSNYVMDVSSVSDLGQKVLKNTDQWKVGRSDHFIVFASDPRSLSWSIEDAEFTYQRIGQWLGLEDHATNQTMVIMIDDDHVWRKVMRSYGIRHDSLSFQYGNELYINNDPEQNKRPDRIEHEIVHARLAQSLPSALPLCIEEGLALYYGWLSAVEFNGRKGITLYRNESAIEAGDMMSLTDLLAVKRYSSRDQKARAFYRQSEELIGAVASRLKPGEIPAFVQKMLTNDIELRERFREACGMDEMQLLDLITEVRKNCLSPHNP